MLVCPQWLCDDALTRAGFEFVDNGPDLPRTAVRAGYSFPLEPACGHPDCPPLVDAALLGVPELSCQPLEAGEKL